MVVAGSRWIVGAVLVSYGFLLVVGFLVAAVTVDSIRKDAILPYEFSEETYDADRFEVCVGDEITWTQVMTVNRPVNTITINTWLDPATRRTVAIDHTARQLIFVPRSGLHEYYEQRGRAFEFADFPVTITSLLTATVPALVSDAPLLLLFTNAFDPRQGDTYVVPLWVKSNDECLFQRGR